MATDHALPAYAFGQSARTSLLAELTGALLADRRLRVAVLFSLLLHGLVLSIHFGIEPRRPADNAQRSLEVVLVNARHERAPDKAEVLAQANVDGGGASEQEVRPTTPLPPQETQRDGDALVSAQQRTPEQPAPPRQQVLAQPAPPKPAPAVRERVEPPPETPPPEPKRIASGLDLMDSVAAIARMEAQIDRQLNEYAKRPRRLPIAGIRARQHHYAQYLEDWRMKIERVGALNYPEAARGRIYGNLLLTVEIRADGSVSRVEIERSSGHPELDQAALSIVKLASPFAGFPPEIAQEADLITITRTWTFTNSDRLSTR